MASLLLGLPPPPQPQFSVSPDPPSPMAQLYPNPPHTAQYSHGPLQFFIFDGAVQGLERNQGVWINPVGRYIMYPSVRAQNLPS